MYSLEDVSAAGDDLATLKALRRKIAAAIDNSNSGRDIAALSRQLTLVMDQIRKLKAQDKPTEIDDLLAKREYHKVRPARPQ